MDLSLNALRAAYAAGTLDPHRLCALIDARAEACSDDNIWIHRLTAAERAPWLDALAQANPADLPLYGVPFAIKDNIDLAGVPTTAACPEYAYVPTRSAFVVERLLALGAIPIGKTNLDQFATGLVGSRSPFGATRNAFNPDYVSGGSSGGSAVACAKGLVSFALGTDTAGSGRVPAALNALIGVKPTRGLLSLRGVVPACQSLDCVSIFASSAADAATLLACAAAHDAEDPWSRGGRPLRLAGASFRYGVPRQLEFFGDTEAPRLFAAARARLQALGGEEVTLDFSPFLEAARLLYEGPWVSERYTAIERFIEQQPEALFPVTREIIGAGRERRAVELFKAQHRLQALKHQTDQVFTQCDCVLTPTLGRPHTLDAVAQDPVRLNSELGHYTNFMNLLDYAALAVPAGIGTAGVPWGVTLFAPAFGDERLLDLGARLLGESAPLSQHSGTEAPEAGAHATLVVCGAHLSGLPLNAELLARGGRLVRACRTAPVYRLYALAGGPPRRPGLLRDTTHGAAIEVEEWALPRSALGDFMAGIPAPLAVGRVELEDGSQPHGFLCEAHALQGAEEITQLGGWRAYLAQR